MYSKRISKAQRNEIKTNRRAVKTHTADIVMHRSLTLAKRSTDTKVTVSN